MTRLDWRLISVLAVLTAPAAACTVDGESMFVLQNQVPERGSDGEACTLAATAGDTFRAKGLLDTTSPGGYEIYPVVQSRAVASGDDELRRAIVVQGADVEVTSEPPGLIDVSFSQRFAGLIVPGGQASFLVEVLSPDDVAAINGGLSAGDRAVVIAKVTVFGELAGGSVESPPFEFPIDVCSGCLINNLGDCAVVPSDTPVLLGGECNPFQDGNIDCCTADGVALCPAVPTGEIL